MLLHVFHLASLSEIEMMVPYERDIYITLLNNWEEEKARRQKQR
jgi:hypothetical protein